MRYLLPALLLASLGQPIELQAQALNLVKNGDFSANTIAPWKASGFALNPALEKLNTSGTGTSVAYACNPGGQSGRPPFPPHVIQQVNMLLLPVVHELSFDMAVVMPQFSLTPLTPTVEAFLGKRRLYSMSFPLTGKSPRRMRACVRFPQTIAGIETLRIEINWASVARANFTPRVYIDNVRLWHAGSPTFCIDGERRLNSAMQFRVVGSPSSAFVIFLAAKLAPKPLSFPGITGMFRLDLLTLFPILNGVTNTQGEFKITLPVPKVPGLGGLPLYWQGVEITTTGASFGLESLQGFYD